MIQDAFRNMIFSRKWWWRHILFWLCYIIVLGLFSIPTHSSIFDAFESTCVWLPVHLLYTYTIIYWLVPKYLITGKYLSFFWFYCAWCLFGLTFNFVWRAFVLLPLREGRTVSITVNSAYKNIFAMFSFIVMNTVAMFAVFIKMFKFWHVEQEQKLKMEKEKISAELKLLKAQLHPHFLFNTLNNVFTLVNEKSDKAPDMLMRLSGLLSYVLYECKADKVYLEKEINIIKDYIALEQERYGERLDISLNFTGDIQGRLIAPMLFQPFVENAFKHGTSEQLGKVWMSIDLSVKNDELLFKLINSCNGSANNNSGIGISNIRKRLELIYRDKFHLQNEKQDELFIVSLAIDLKNA